MERKDCDGAAYGMGFSCGSVRSVMAEIHTSILGEFKAKRLD